MEGFGGLEFIPTVLSILVVLAILFGTLLVLKWVSALRFGGPGRDRRGSRLVEIVERHVIGRSGAILVLRYGGRELVVGVTESSMTPLAEGTIDLRGDLAEADDAGVEEHSPVENRPGRLDRLRDLTTRR